MTDFGLVWIKMSCHMEKTVFLKRNATPDDLRISGFGILSQSLRLGNAVLEAPASRLAKLEPR